MKIERDHRKATIGERTVLRVRRAGNSHTIWHKGITSFIFPKYGYKLVVAEDTKLKQANVFQKYQYIPVIKVKH